MGGQGHADEARRSCKVEPNLVLSARSVNIENTLRACTASNGLEYLGLGLPMSFYALTPPTARPSSPHVFPTTLSGMTNARIFVRSTPSPHARFNPRPCRTTTPASSRPSRRVRKASRARGGRYSSASGEPRRAGLPAQHPPCICICHPSIRHTPAGTARTISLPCTSLPRPFAGGACPDSLSLISG